MIRPIKFYSTSKNHQEKESTQLLFVKNLKFKPLNKTNEDEMLLFDSDSTHLRVDSCSTDGLTRINSNFMEGPCTEVAERCSDTTTRKSIMFRKGIAACTLKDDNGELFSLKTKMECAPSRKFSLISPQWLDIQERE